MAKEKRTKETRESERLNRDMALLRQARQRELESSAPKRGRGNEPGA